MFVSFISCLFVYICIHTSQAVIVYLFLYARIYLYKSCVVLMYRQLNTYLFVYMFRFGNVITYITYNEAFRGILV